MSGAAPQTASPRSSSYGLPLRTIPINESPSASASTANQAHAQPQPKRGIRVRVNSLGATMLLKHNAATPTDHPSSSAMRSDSPSANATRSRSATWRSPDPTPSSASVSPPPQPHSATPSTSNSGFNRRKFFGRSNSIRSLLGGVGSSNAASSSSAAVSTDAAAPSPKPNPASRPSSASSPASQHPLGLLRRMGSKSFLNLNQSNQATPANPSSDDASSLASADSEPSKRFSDSLKRIGRRRGKSVSTNPRSSSSQSSSDFQPGRLTHSELLPAHDASRRSIESARSSTASITTTDPNHRHSESDPVDSRPKHDSRDLHQSAPRRLTGWLYNMVGSDNSPSPLEQGAPLSPVREADINEVMAQASISPSKHSRDTSANAHSSDSIPSRSKAGALLHSWTTVGSAKHPRSPQASTAETTQSATLTASQTVTTLATTGTNSATNTSGAGAGSNSGGDASASGSASGSGIASTSSQAGGGNAANTSSWVPGGVGLDRAFKFFLDTDPSANQDEGIWLLGVWHAPRQSQKSEPPIAQEPRSATRAVASDAADDDHTDARRAASPSSSVSASSPRRGPLDLNYASFAPTSSSNQPDRTTVGSSISTGATASTAESLRTRSSATSFNIASSGPTPPASESQSAFQPDFASRIWCTYRNHFAPIARDGTISDQAASAAEALAIAQSQPSDPATPSAQAGASSNPDPTRSSSPPASASRGWLGRKTAESNVAHEAAPQASSPLGLGAALGAGYVNASATLGEKMGITNLWSRATAAAQAAGFSRAGLTTDSGWGCMLRTGQSLLANALINVHLGRSWQRETAPKSQIEFFEELANASLDASAENQSLASWRERRARHATYIRILSWFLDDPSPACPFGVHRMAREGKRLGKEVGEWFGPSTAAGAIKQLVFDFPEAGIAVELAHDGVFYLDEVRAAASASTGKSRASGMLSGNRRAETAVWRRPVLILIGIRLGLETVNPIYYESVKATFSFPQSVGIAGGRPSSSYYFMGHQGNSLFYLDPHNVRPAVPLRYPPTTFPAAAPSRFDVSHRYALEDRDDEDEWWSHAYTEAQTSTFHCEKVRRMPIKSLDPSMLLGFLVKDEEALVDLCARIKALPKTIFSFAESAPKWVDDDDFDPSMESFSEPSADEAGSDDDVGKGEDQDDVPPQRETRADKAEGTSQRSSPKTSVVFPSKRDTSPGESLYRESQQRTAAWLGHGRPAATVAKADRADGAGAGGIAFPSLDLLTPHNDSLGVQRPNRSDMRQVSTSSAATTRPMARKATNAMGTDEIDGRDLTTSAAVGAAVAGTARTGKVSPSRSPARAGPDESFSTVHLSDSEVGSGWEEVSDGGTIAPSASATSGLHRTGSPAPLGAAPSAADPSNESTWEMSSMRDGLTPEEVVSPISVVSESELVGVSLDTPTDEAAKNPFSAAGAKQASPVAPIDEGARHAGLTTAHTPLALPRRRTQSKPSPIDKAPSSDTSAPPVPSVPAAFLHAQPEPSDAASQPTRAPDLDASDDDF
ncbi:hypothetical protein PaG_04127 [Moesziomyces aphidis]|uniref:Autophagy-related protein 4 n=1 Tax=Moesziomyces aphidis TaxID=84754 RepID=W3VJD5_MOEAP|nr:hypothetical protein PaG_04127 [Moesziomyces aphidis]